MNRRPRSRSPGLLAASLALGLLVSGCASVPEEEMGAAVFYPAPPAEPRLQLLGRYSAAKDVEGTSAFRTFVVGEEAERRLDRAHGVAWSRGRIYVCDPARPDVVVFDLAAREMRSLGGGRPGLFKKPIEIAVAPDGFKYVTDTVHRLVLVFDAEDRYERAFGKPEAWKPVGIAVTGDLLYVTDTANHQLVVLDRRTGEERRRIGELGEAPGRFYYPLSVAVGPGGDLYVSDSFNFRIQRLRPDGTYVRSYGEIGKKPGQFARPRGVAVDREGRIYAIDAAFENVQIFDAEGRLLLFFGRPGGHPGALNLPASMELSYDAVPAFREKVAPGYDIDYVLFVTSQTGPQKVNVYGFLRKR